MRHWVPSSGCVLLEGTGTGTYHFNFPCQSGHLMGQLINHMIFLMRSIPQYILCVQNGTSVTDGAIPWKRFHQGRTFPRLPPSLGVTLTQALAESKISFLLNLLKLEDAIRAFLTSSSSETQHYREGIPGLMRQIRAGMSSHEYSKEHCSSSYTPCSVPPAFLGGSELCNEQSAPAGLSWTVHQTFLTPRAFHTDLSKTKAFTMSLVFAHACARRTLFLTYNHTF